MLKKIKFRSLLANSWVLLFLAACVAGGLTFLLYKYLNERENKLKADMGANKVRNAVQVVVPARDLPVGTQLSSGDFVSREVQGDLVYDDMVRPENFEQYRTSHLVKPVRRGLPLRAGDIDALRGRDFSDILPEGQRAVTLDIDTINSTALMLRPGNRVDVYWIGKVFHPDGASDEKKMVQLMMPNALVLATGQDLRPRDAGEAAEHDQANASAMNRQENTGYSTVTLQVPAEEVGRLTLAQKIGGLRLILRNADDKGHDGPPLVEEKDVFTDPAQPGMSSGKRATSQSVEVISGGGAGSASIVPSMQSDAAHDAPAAATAPPVGAQTAPRLPQHQQSVYEQANAIAQQLQKAVAPGASQQN
ncbi:Flp pilus assembly protein CpaB [Paraburkholderia sp. MPAMCS5]|uniref:Flp pilus assembly protein CpaB n=1 Tax=Paraburkholderia sp. MPAMCS5 TaxID=3112563 RepID=UPI002E191752|nr:Flp pilus assembly protein CpaB [Paraburkholderia sp. MPAMCS5]